MQAMSPPRRFAVEAAVIASAGAGLVHAAAVGTHAGEPTLVRLFAFCAIAQVGIAGLVLLRPTRPMLAALGTINLAAFGCWAMSRTVGLPGPRVLNGVEAVGTSDLIAALFAFVAVCAALAFVVRPASKRILGPAWTVVALVGAMALTVPALAAGTEHVHGEAAHDHAAMAGDEHAASEHHSSAAAGTHDHGTDTEVAGETATHGHDTTTTGTGGTEDGHGHSTSTPSSSSTSHHSTPTNPADPSHHSNPSNPTDPSHQHPPTSTPTSPPTHEHPPPTPTPTGPIITLDDPRLTPAQHDAALSLILRTAASMTRFTDVASVEAAGYTSIGDAITGWEHFVNWTNLGTPAILDPDTVESVVFKVNPDGSRTLASAMYILPLGQTQANVPEIAGELTTWHDHTNLCWDLTGNPRVVAITDANGNCPRGVLFVTPPMLHVWLIPHPCGPFAGIDGGHGEGCVGHDH